MYDIDRPGAHYLLDHLCLLSQSGAAKAIRSWPNLAALRRRGPRTAWKPFEPTFRLICRSVRDPVTRGGAHALPERPGVDSAAVAALTSASSVERRQCAFDEFRSTFPEELARCAERFPSRHYLLLLLFSQRIEAVELATQSPALAFCLAHRSRFRRTGSRMTTADMLRRKQRDILGWLGFPDREGAARILAKIAPEAVHLTSMFGLRRVLRDTTVCKLLAHVPTVNAGVLGLVSDRRLLTAVTPRLLTEVAASKEELSRTTTAALLTDIQAMARHVRHGDVPPAFFSIRRLREVHDDVNRTFAKRQRDTIPSHHFPSPPVPGSPNDIIPLCTPEALFAEGAEQGHCVATYTPRVAAGEVFIYKVLRPERATLSIVRDPGGGWQIGQLVLRSNGEPRSSTWDHVESWLAAHADGQ